MGLFSKKRREQSEPAEAGDDRAIGDDHADLDHDVHLDLDFDLDLDVDLDEDVDADVDLVASPGLGDSPVPPPPESRAELPSLDAGRADTGATNVPAAGSGGSEDQLSSTDGGWHLPDLSEISGPPIPPPPPLPGDKVTFDEPESMAPPRPGVASEGWMAEAPGGPGPDGPEAVAHLEVLGLIPGSSWEEIRSAHAELVVGYAQIPESDTRHQQVAAEMCREINTAYASLRLMAAA